jgi:hypothetical protein
MTIRRQRVLRLSGKVLRIGAVVIAIFAALGGVVALLHGPGPAALRKQPVDARATVTDVYINGFGGDPTVAYAFDVEGATYKGSGTGGELGNGDVQKLGVGDSVSIQYAATDPSLSCTCDARNADSWRLPRGGGIDPYDLFLFAPLAAAAGWYAWRRTRTKQILRGLAA